MVQPPLGSRRLRRDLKPRHALKELNVPIVFEPPLQPPKPAVQVFPGPIEGKIVKQPLHSRKQMASAAIDESKLEGFLPDQLALNPDSHLWTGGLDAGSSSIP